jgi:hypothetical protein
MISGKVICNFERVVAWLADVSNKTGSFIDPAQPDIYTEHGHKLRILKIRDNIVKIEKVVKRLRND